MTANTRTMPDPNWWAGNAFRRVVPVSYFRWQLDPSVTVGLALVAATQRLSSAGVDSPRLDSEVLLAHVLRCSRADLYAYPERRLSDVERQEFEQLVERRFHHEPVAYLVGEKAFYGLQLAVDRRVLIPRPETELLVDLALELVEQAARRHGYSSGKDGHRERDVPALFQVADVGTGSGAIALAIAAHTPYARIYALDISEGALELAQENARRHGLDRRVKFLHGDLLTPLSEPVDLIIANLPYVATAEWERLAPDITEFEPSQALLGGPDGLDVIRRLLAQAPAYLRPNGTVLLEIGSEQGAAVTELAAGNFPTAFIEVVPDYGHRDRIVRIQLS